MVKFRFPGAATLKLTLDHKTSFITLRIGPIVKIAIGVVVGPILHNKRQSEFEVTYNSDVIHNITRNIPAIIRHTVIARNRSKSYLCKVLKTFFA